MTANLQHSPNRLTRWQPWRCLEWLALWVCLGVGGCAGTFSPAEDDTVLESLKEINLEAMTLFASLAAGVRSDSFSARAQDYTVLVGKVDAVALLAGARLAPVKSLSEDVQQLLSQRGAAPAQTDTAISPSAYALQKISQTLSKMRDIDRRAGLGPLEARAFKAQTSIYLDQAITYEKFLQR